MTHGQEIVADILTSHDIRFVLVDRFVDVLSCYTRHRSVGEAVLQARDALRLTDKL